MPVRFLRKEKDIAEAKFEVVQAEVSRLKETLSYHQKQAEDANRTLSKERQTAQVQWAGLVCQLHRS